MFFRQAYWTASVNVLVLDSFPLNRFQLDSYALINVGRQCSLNQMLLCIVSAAIVF